MCAYRERPLQVFYALCATYISNTLELRYVDIADTSREEFPPRLSLPREFRVSLPAAAN